MLLLGSKCYVLARPVALATVLRLFLVLASEPTPYPLFCSVVPSLHEIYGYHPLTSSLSSSFLLLISLFSSNSFSPYNLCSSSSHALSYHLLISCYSWSKTDNISQSLVVVRNSCTAAGVFPNYSHRLTMFDYNTIVVPHFLHISAISFLNALQSNMTWWTSILDWNIQS